MNYLELLNYSFNYNNSLTGADHTKKSYLCDYIFQITTYDDEISELFTTKALEVCNAITNSKTLEYIFDKNNYCWYLILCNIPFFKKNIEWGTSIRGAFWNYNFGGKIEIESTGLFWDEEQILKPLIFNNDDEWKLFIKALNDFVKGE